MALREVARGAVLALHHSVQLSVMAYVVWLGVISCGGPAAPTAHAPIPVACTPMRIGTVTVTGATPKDVPALAVLAGTIDDRARTERVVGSAIETLRSRGYARAAIAVTRQPACFTDLAVAVTLGPRYRIRAIDFVTGDEFPARERLAALEDELGTVNTIGGSYIEYRLVRALAGLEQRYHDAGWLDAKIAAPTAAYDDTGGISITVAVTPGPRYRVGAIRARGAGAAARKAVLEEIQIEPGAWYDGPAIRHGLARARRRLDRWVELRTLASTDRGEIELEAVLETR
jgi:outer membrane protein assembly factor BamA